VDDDWWPVDEEDGAPVRPSAPVPPSKPPEPPQFEQVQPGQQVSPEWRHERETPSDLPQAPESAWAQPPTAPLPIVRPPVTPPAKPSAPRAPLGVPHQVPPAPMPRPADDPARPRAERRPEPPAEMGPQGAVRRSTFGSISPAASGRREQERHAELDLIQRRFGGPRQITVVNPVERSGKSVAAQLLALTFGEQRGEPVLAWDIAETPGTLGLHAPAGVYHQGAFDLLATRGSTSDFGARRDALSSSYRILVVSTGADPDAEDWRAAVDATDQLVVAIFGRNESAAGAAGILNYLERVGRVRTARSAVAVLALPQNPREIDAAGIEHDFAERTRVVVRIPYDRGVGTLPIDFRQLSDATRAAWIKAAAAVAEGL
jgi:hypothetical protein